MALPQSLIQSIADAKDKEPRELEIALENHISTAAIRKLDDHNGESWTLQFELPNHTVEITGDGTILVDGSEKQTSA